MASGLDIRAFTAEISCPDGKRKLGTGFLVSEDGLIATAYHVVKEFHEKKRPVTVRFAKAASEQKTATAQYVGRPGKPEDDLILLRVADKGLELPNPALIAAADERSGNRFTAYGYAEFGVGGSFWLEGQIKGLVEHRDFANASDLLQLACEQAEKGLSGSAVVDLVRNVVVGIVSSRVRRDGVDTAHAVDARLLLSVAGIRPSPDVPAKINPADLPREDVAPLVLQLAASALADRLTDAPGTFKEFVPRLRMAAACVGDWRDPAARVTAVIGIGGEGKTSFARRWLEGMEPQPTARFWWPCYEVAEPDKLLAALMDWLTAGKAKGEALPQGRERVQVILTLLRETRAAVVIDGFEVLQHGPGDRFGEITDADLRALFVGMCQMETRSRMLITTRFPLPDLAGFLAYRPRHLARLDQRDGVRLLRNFGVAKGDDAALSALTERWDGHALTLGLIGAYIRDYRAGDPAQAADIQPLAGEDQYAKVRRVMARYDRDLTDLERSFLVVLSAFRRAVSKEVIVRVFRQADGPDDPAWPLRRASGEAFGAMLKRLMALSILRPGVGATLTVHPLVHAHYRVRQEALSARSRQTLHRRIADYYQSVAKPPVKAPDFPTLDDLAPWVEAVHHLLAADEPQAAFAVLLNKIEQQERFVLAQLGAMRLLADILDGFLTDIGHSRLPDGPQSYLCVNWLGCALETLGETRAALALHRRNLDYVASVNTGISRAAALSHVLRLLVRLGGDGDGEPSPPASSVTPAKAGVQSDTANLSKHLDSGLRRNDGETAAPPHSPQGGEGLPSILALLDEILTHLEALSGKTLERNDITTLKGVTDAAAFTGDAVALGRAEKLAQIFTVDLCAWTGGDSLIPYLEHHRRRGPPPQDWDKIWKDSTLSTAAEIIYRRTLGDLAASVSEKRAHYDAAVTNARKTTNRLALMGVLNARGRFLARHGEIDRARGDLEEAFQYALDAEDKLEEINARVGLAWLYQAEGRPDRARTMAGRALDMAGRINYPWGRDDAGEVLAALDAAR